MASVGRPVVVTGFGKREFQAKKIQYTNETNTVYNYKGLINTAITKFQQSVPARAEHKNTRLDQGGCAMSGHCCCCCWVVLDWRPSLFVIFVAFCICSCLHSGGIRGGCGCGGGGGGRVVAVVFAAVVLLLLLLLLLSGFANIVVCSTLLLLPRCPVAVKGIVVLSVR